LFGSADLVLHVNLSFLSLGRNTFILAALPAGSVAPV